MVALKLSSFGGMVPAVDPYLLPENQAELSQNTWMYSGAIEGMHTPKVVHTLISPTAKRVFRIPVEYYDKDHIQDSYWMEFESPDVDVIRTPVIDDQFERYYWAGQGVAPAYNTRARIIASSAAYTLGIPAPSVAPRVTRADGQFYLEAGSGGFTLRGNPASIYYSRAYAQDADSFGSGSIDANGYALYGATTPTSSTRGNLDQSTTPVATSVAANLYRMTGSRAELRYTTTVADNRVTISDSGSTTIGVPAQPNSATSSNPYVGSGVQEARSYVYTWVSAYGEEGPPSPATLYTGWSGDPWKITLTAPTVDDTAGRNLSKVRIYRTVTAAGGATTYFQITEKDIAVTQFVDDISDDVAADGALLESLYWTAPPTDLKGMISLPNGIIAGFRDNEVWFCEPYRPHAWPSPYTVSVDSPIVGLGAIGQTLVICTSTQPYAMSGVNPATMTLSKLPVIEPCLSRGSIVSMPTGVAYASPNGIVLVAPGVAQVISRQLINKDQWLDEQQFLFVPSLRAVMLNGAYYCWGSVMSGCFQADAFQPNAFLQDDFTGAYLGAFIDLQDRKVAYTKLFNAEPTYNCFADAWTGEVFLVRNGQVLWLDVSGTAGRQSYLWRSKLFEMPNQRNMEALRVYFQTYSDTPALNPVRNTSQSQSLAADQYGLLRVYADERLVLVRELRETGEFVRVPSGFKATFWQVEVEARVKLRAIEAATVAKELLSV